MGLRHSAVIVTLLASAVSSSDAGQVTPPWTVQVATDRAEAEFNGVVQQWTTDRVAINWVKPSEGGWFTGVERHTRSERTDWTTFISGYRRVGPWTFLGGAAGTPDADFHYRSAFEVEVSRIVRAPLVATGGYRRLAFRSGTVHIIQPAMTWYYARGEILGRGYVSRSTEAGRTSSTAMVRILHDFHERVRVTVGAAYGDRVFDVASLPSSSTRTRLGFGHVRLSVTRNDAIETGVTIAREGRAFEYRAVSLGYRRTF